MWIRKWISFIKSLLRIQRNYYSDCYFAIILRHVDNSHVKYWEREPFDFLFLYLSSMHQRFWVKAIRWFAWGLYHFSESGFGFRFRSSSLSEECFHKLMHLLASVRLLMRELCNIYSSLLFPNTLQSPLLLCFGTFSKTIDICADEDLYWSTPTMDQQSNWS